MKKILIILLLFFTSIIYPNDETNYVHHLGIWGGGTTGAGISYRYRPSDWSIQFQFLPYYNAGDAFIYGGLSFQKYIAESTAVALLFFTGLSGIYRSESYGHYDENNNWIEEKRYIGNVNLGIGPGLEFKIRRIILTFCAGYGFSFQYHPSFDIAINFTGEAGIYFRF